MTCEATDAHGNTMSVTFDVVVQDTTPPVLTLNGENPMTVEGGTPFVDPGATATDTVAGDLTAQIQVTGTVNTAVVGSYYADLHGERWLQHDDGDADGERRRYDAAGADAERRQPDDGRGRHAVR